MNFFFKQGYSLTGKLVRSIRIYAEKKDPMEIYKNINKFSVDVEIYYKFDSYI